MPDELKSTRPAPFRLAFRVEGAFWNAYLADAGTMTNAILLGSIRMAAVEDRDRKARFMELMKESLEAALMDAAGVAMSWPEPARPAPEHERGGNA